MASPKRYVKMAVKSIPNVRKYRSDTRSATKPDANIANPYENKNAESNVPSNAAESGPSVPSKKKECKPN